MKRTFTKLVPIAALLCIVYVACQKNAGVAPSPTPRASSQTMTTNMIGAMSSETDVEMASILAPDAPSGPCAIVTYNPSKDVYPQIKTTDYGTGCTDDDGITRSGKRFSTIYADKYTAPAGKVISVTSYSNFYLDGVSVSGNVKVSVVQPASSGQLILKVAVNKTVTDSVGNTSSFINTATQKQIAGNGTSQTNDDVFQIYENAYGTEVLGDTTMVTWKAYTDPSNVILKANGCQFRSQGALDIVMKQLGVTTNEVLDYGNGDCDRNATLSIDGGTPEPVTLPFQSFEGL